MPYAEAMIFEQAPINLCPPGGVKTLKKLGELLQKNPEPYIPEMEEKSKPTLLAVIREDECIGCTKCIQACPVDAILGGAKQMHTVIAAECTGCELCVAPCPVDCIDIIELPQEITKEKSDLARSRFNARQSRLTQEKIIKTTPLKNESQITKKNYIQDAIARAREKKKI